MDTKKIVYIPSETDDIKIRKFKIKQSIKNKEKIMIPSPTKKMNGWCLKVCLTYNAFGNSIKWYDF